MHRAPMNTPFVCLRMTAYHMVVASPLPWIRCQGRGGPASRSPMTPAPISCFCVAT